LVIVLFNYNVSLHELPSENKFIIIIIIIVIIIDFFRFVLDTDLLFPVCVCVVNSHWTVTYVSNLMLLYILQ